MHMDEKVYIGDDKLSIKKVVSIANGAPVELYAQAKERIAAARALVEAKLAEEQPVYGVTTGFGALAETNIPKDQLCALQENLILSHAAGVGRPLSRPETRAMLALRAQTLATGHSGARLELIESLLDLLNHHVHPVIPEKGSVGASGDLAPLAHLALTVIGKGDAEYEGTTMPAAEALAQAGLKPVTLQAKEGLSLVNGTQAMAGVGALALHEAAHLCRLADIAGAMTMEGLNGLTAAFDERVQAVRPHPGQMLSARNLRRLSEDSQLTNTTPKAQKVQDPYSMRCMPQVHGASRDALQYCSDVFTRELNSATDNPLVFANEGEIISGGNFHGQPLALALDFAAIALSEIGNISERRVEQLVNPALSGLPPFLVPESGIHSGYMIAQVTAAALVNENKVFCTPASVDSIPGSASREDHVSMGMTSARKLREIVQNTRVILAVEILCATQAIDFRKPAKPGKGTIAAYKRIRSVVPNLDKDRLLQKDIYGVLELEEKQSIVNAVEDAVGQLD